MSGEPLDARERNELCDLLLELGPDAPTLCDGWDARDLAAHLVVRERDPRALPGLFVARFEHITRRRMERQAERPWEALVHAVRDGPPIGPLAVPRLRTVLNLPELFVHHEDVRRADGRGARTWRGDLDDALWRLLRRVGRLWAVRLRGAGLDVVRAGGGAGSGGELVSLRAGAPRARLRGTPQEIVLYLFGRRQVADVELDGEPDAVRTVTRARFGF